MYFYRFIKWWREQKECKLYEGLPEYCWHCDLLGICRASKEDGWKCHKGCILLNIENERKYEGLPRGCWKCEHLTICRRPKEEGWKCYNGCIKINKRKKNTEK